MPAELVPGAAAVVPKAPPPIMDIDDPMPCAPPMPPPRANAAAVERPMQRATQRTKSFFMSGPLAGAGRQADLKGFRLGRSSTLPRT